MSIPKPRRFTYYERVKSTYEMVNDTESKSLCTNLLKFIEECVGDSKSTALDFTDKKSEENISQFLAKNEAFFGTVFESFCKFHAKGLFDLLSREGAGKKDLNKSRILIGHIEKNCYQILCLCALYSPSALQQRLVTELSAFLAKSQLETPLGLTEITAWTALLLLINPIKLKYQCDGSIEVFTHFNKVLQQGPPSMQNNSLPSSTQFPSSSLASRSPLPSGSSSLKKDWANPCLKGTIQLALGVSIKFARNSLGLGIPHELDECIFVDEGIKKMALEFLQACLVQVPAFCDLAFSVDVLDSILKNFICYFPDKLVEMYNLCEEELYSLLDWQNSKSTAVMDASTTMELEGGVPRQNQTNFDNMHFKTLLELIAALYEPENPQLTKLSMEFTDPNFEALCDFVQRGRAISTPALQIAYLSMLKSLCKSPQSAEMFFNIFR